jgi:NAD(P)H-flavin reductase
MTSRNQLQPCPVTLVNKRKENYETTTYSFQLPDSDFEYTPGQFNMLSLLGAGEAPISISGYDPEQGIIDHTIRHVGNVTFSLSRLEEGDTVQLRGPYGKGWPVKQAEGHYVVFLTGGIGLAPLIPAIEHVWRDRRAYKGVELLFGARSVNDRMFHAELDEWDDDGMIVRHAVDALQEGDEWSHHVGFVTDLIPEIKGQQEDIVVFMCGPEIMMKVAAGILKDWGLTSKQIFVSLERRMKCGVGTCGHCQLGPYFVCKDGPVFNLNALEPLPVL